MILDKPSIKICLVSILSITLAYFISEILFGFRIEVLLWALLMPFEGYTLPLIENLLSRDKRNKKSLNCDYIVELHDKISALIKNYIKLY